MTVEIALVLGLVVSAVILFATERLPVDLTAMIIMGAMLLSGIITTQDAIGGFSNPATVTVGAMFILSAGLFKTGAVNLIGDLLSRVGKKSFWLVLVVMMLLVGLLSAFINNTAAVAIFLPVVLTIARECGFSAARLLMPLSFASMFGGVCTLIGTSTTILVSSIIERYGLAPIGMFEPTALGLIFFAAGAVYMVLVGVRLLPERAGDAGHSPGFGSGEYQIEIILEPEARSVGTVLGDSPLLQDINLSSVEVFRQGELLKETDEKLLLQAGDHLKVRCDLENFRKLRERRGITLRHEKGDAPNEEASLVEAVIASGSTLDGRSLKQSRFRSRYGLQALAVRHRNRVMREDLEEMPLKAGDVLLFEMESQHLEQLREDRTFVLVSQVALPLFRKSRMLIASAIVTAVVLAAATGYVPIIAGAIIGCILMVLTRCLSLQEAYGAINWQVIFLMAGVMTLGTALETTGAARLLGSGLVRTLGSWGPMAMVATLYLFSALITAILSNNATVALLIPIVLATANSMRIDPRPLIMAVTYAASLDFMTPFGYQTNTLIYGPGQFRFADFLRVGTPLNILFWILATIFIPRFWPF